MKTAAAVLALAGLAGCAGIGAGERDGMDVNMRALNQSGEHGTARLQAQDGKTRVVLNLQNAPKDTLQPAHIHEGTCDSLSPKPAWPLDPVVDGKAASTVPVTLKTLRQGPYAINVHRSAEDIKTYVACGNIR